MSDWDRYLQPGETVVRSFGASIPSRAALAVIAAFFVPPVLIGLALFLIGGARVVDWLYAGGWVIAALVVMGPLMAGLILVLDRAMSKTVLTNRRIIRINLWPSRQLTDVDLNDIASFTFYEGSKDLEIEGDQGNIVLLDSADREMARALGAPGKIWRFSDDWFYRGKPVTAKRILMAAVGGAVLGPIYMSSIFLGDIWFASDPVEVATAEYYLPIAAASGFALSPFLLLTGVGIHFIRGRRANAERRRSLACEIANPLWLGLRPPEGQPPALQQYLRRIDAWIIRKAYGGPYDCSVEPEVMAPDKAKKPPNPAPP